jgi:hypothetical protein
MGIVHIPILFAFQSFASLCHRKKLMIFSVDVNITGEGVVLGPLVAMRYLIVAIVTMRQK